MADRAEASEPDRPDEEPTPAESAEEREPEWWEDPSLPWQHKPTRADKICLAAITLAGLFALAMIPARAYLIVHNPLLLVALTGSRSGTVTLGALAAVGRGEWLPGLLLGIPSVIKFDLLYFWAGRLWGEGFLATFAHRSKGSARRAARARRWALKYGTPAVLISYLPIPIPAAVIYATVATAGMSWRRFIVVNLAAATVMQSLYMYLGYRIGAPAVALLDAYARYSGRVTLVLFVVIIVVTFWRQYRAGRERSQPVEGSPEDR